MKYLVTGAAGFIGGQLCHKLWALDGTETVVGIDNYSYGKTDNLHFQDVNLESIVQRIDIRDEKAIMALLEKYHFDVVYNIAGIAALPVNIALYRVPFS